jgi:hypothetical protein
MKIWFHSKTWSGESEPKSACCPDAGVVAATESVTASKTKIKSLKFFVGLFMFASVTISCGSERAA